MPEAHDLRGDGKTLLRGNFATYASQRNLATPDRFLQTTGTAAILFLCDDPACSATGLGPQTPADQSMLVDLNGNGVIDAGDALDWFGTDPSNPGGQVIDTFDPDFSAPKSLETIVGVEHELMPDFAIGGNFIYRRNWNLVWSDDFVGSGTSAAGRLSRPLQAAGGEFTGANPGAILTPADYEPVTEGGVTYYRLKPGVERGAGSHSQNRPNFHNAYKGFEITARKRLSNNWMLNTSFTFRDWTNTFDCFDEDVKELVETVISDSWSFPDLRP